MDIENIVSTFFNEFKDELNYIHFPNLILTKLEQSNFTTQEKIQILKEINLQNEIIYNRLKQSLKITTKKKNQRKNEQDYLHPIKEEEISTIKKENINVKDYLEKIYTCEFSDYIYDILPSPYDPLYEKIVTKIELEVLLSIKSCISLYNEMEDLGEMQELEYIKQEIEKLENILDELNKCINEKDEEEIIEEILPNNEKNNIIFLKINGNNIPKKELESISTALYPSVLSLLSSIENNYFPRVKTYRSDLLGIRAMRKGQLRILFQQLDNNTFVILNIFEKKCQTSQQYRNEITLTKEQLNQFLSLLPFEIGSNDWEEYKNKEANELNDIIDILNKSIKIKKK